MIRRKPILGRGLNYGHPLARGIVGCWLMNEGAGPRVNDLTGNRRNGSFYGDTAWIAGPRGHCLSFDGAGDYVSASIPNLPHITISAFVKIAANPGANALIAGVAESLGSNTNDKDLYVDTNGKVRFYVHDGSGRTTSVPTDALSLGVWHHVVAVADGKNAYVYVNSLQVGTCAAGNTYTAYTSPEFFIDGTVGVVTPFGYLAAQIDDVRVWNRGLTAAEIAQLYADPFAMFQRPVMGVPFAPAGGGAMHELAGSVSAAAGVTGDLRTGLDWELVGSVSAACTVTANLNRDQALGHYAGLRSNYDFAADPHCVSLYNGETWATYLKDQSGEGQDLQCYPQINTADFKQGDGCMEFDNSTRESIVKYTDDSLGAGWPGKGGTANRTISLCMWFKAHEMPGAYLYGLISKYHSWSLNIYNNRIYWSATDGGVLTWKGTANTLQANVWYHVGVTFDNSDKSYRIRVYDSSISGNWVDTTGNFANNMTIDNEEVWIGYNDFGSGLGYQYDGLLDDVGVFNDVLTAGEIDQCRAGTYNYASDGHCVAHWPFDTVNFLTDDKADLPIHEISCPTPDWTVYRMGTASLRFTNTALHPAYRNDTDLSAGYPYKAGTANLEWGCCFWVRFKTGPGARVGLVSKHISTQGSVAVECYVGEIGLWVRYGAGVDWYGSGLSPNADTWYHVVVGVSASANTYLINVWDDTAKTETQASGTLLHDPVVSSYPWIYGDMQITGAGIGLDGWMDDIAQFDAPIPAATITEIRLESSAFAALTVTGTLGFDLSLRSVVSCALTVSNAPIQLKSGRWTGLVMQEPAPVPMLVAPDMLMPWSLDMARYVEYHLSFIMREMAKLGQTKETGWE